MRFTKKAISLLIALCMMLSVMVAVVVYLVSVIALRAITLEEMELIPGGRKLGKLLHIH